MNPQLHSTHCNTCSEAERRGQVAGLWVREVVGELRPGGKEVKEEHQPQGTAHPKGLWQEGHCEHGEEPGGRKALTHVGRRGQPPRSPQTLLRITAEALTDFKQGGMFTWDP